MVSNHNNKLLTHVRLSLLLLLLLPLGAQAQELFDSEAEAKLPQLSKTILIEDGRTPAVYPGASETRWVWPYTHDMDVGFMRLHIRVHRFSQVSDWELVVKDGTGNVVDRIGPSSFFGAPPEAQFWTKRIEGKKVRVELHSTVNPIGLDLEIDRLMYEFFLPGPQAITTGHDDMQDLVKDYTRSSNFYTYSQPVSAIFFVRVRGTSETNCTGFLLAPQILITNQHCISQPWQLNGARVIFNYEKDPPRQETFGIKSILMQDVPLDFSLLELDRPATGWPTVKIDLNPISVGEELVLIEHPNKKVKTVSVKDCSVEKVKVQDFPNRENDFYHLCDTESGASGSPVMNRSTGRVVGLHHDGITDVVFNRGRNLAVTIRAILEHIKTEDHEGPIYQKIIHSTL